MPNIFDLHLPSIMSRGSFALQAGEMVVWQGKPFYRKWGLPLAILVSAFLTALYYLAPQPVPPSTEAGQGLALILGLLILSWIRIDTKYAAVTYYVTDRRVVRSQRFPIFGNAREIPLQSLVGIGAKRRFGRGYVVFQSRDTSTLTFGNLHENPEELKKATERTMLARRPSLHQE